MSIEIARLFVFADEWFWLALCLWLFSRWIAARAMWLEHKNAAQQTTTIAVNFVERAWRCAFFTVLIIGAVLVYGVSYPLFWRFAGPLP
jgi:cobalamin synthase